MARRQTDDIPTEPLIPVATIAIRTGQLDEVIWRRLDARGWRAQQDWDDTWVVPRSQAREIFVELTAAKADYDRAEHVYAEKQQADELEGRLQPVRAFEAAERAARTRVRGVEVTAPGAEKPWADLPSEGDD